MTTPIYTITKPAAKETIPSGLWAAMAPATKEHVAQIYVDKIFVSSPFVKWLSQPQRIVCRKSAVQSQKVVDAVLSDIANGCNDAAWNRIFLAMTSCGEGATT